MTEDDDAPHFMIVPAYVDQAIEAKLDAAFAGLPYTAEDRISIGTARCRISLSKRKAPHETRPHRL